MTYWSFINWSHFIVTNNIKNLYKPACFWCWVLLVIQKQLFRKKKTLPRKLSWSYKNWNLQDLVSTLLQYNINFIKTCLFLVLCSSGHLTGWIAPRLRSHLSCVVHQRLSDCWWWGYNAVCFSPLESYINIIKHN